MKYFQGKTTVILFIWEFFEFRKNLWYSRVESSRSSGKFSNSENFADSGQLACFPPYSERILVMPLKRIDMPVWDFFNFWKNILLSSTYLTNNIILQLAGSGSLGQKAPPEVAPGRKAPWKCFKGETTVILFNCDFFKFRTISWYSHVQSSRSSGNFFKFWKFPWSRTACLLSSFRGVHSSPTQLLIPQMNASAKPGIKETHDKVSKSVNFSIYLENFLLWPNSEHLKSTTDWCVCWTWTKRDNW